MRNHAIRKNAPFAALVKHWRLTLMLLPVVVLVIIFNYIPMSFLVIAFKDYNLGLGVWGSPWVGLKYFQQIFTYPDMYRLIWNSFFISMLNLIFGFPAPILLALLINELKQVVFKRAVQTISYLPHFFPWTVIAGIIMFFFSIDGVVNDLLKSWGWHSVNFMTSPTHFIQLLVASGIWKEIGWGTIIYLAAIAGINPNLYEAAIVDGANRFQRLRLITLPGLRPAVGITLIFAMGSLLSVNFDQIYNLYNPQVYEVSDVIDTFVVRAGVFGMQYSLTTAIGLFKGAVGLVLIVLCNYLVRKTTGQEYSLF